MTSQFADITTSLIFFIFPCLVVKFSYWSKFHANIITASGVITILVYKGLTRNLEIENTPVWVLPNIWRLGQVRATNFWTNISFNVSVLFKKKQQGGGGGSNLLRLVLKA